MLNEYRSQTILGIWGGAAFFGLGYFFSGAPQAAYAYFGSAIMIAGYILFVCGCFMYAKGKGRSFWWGVLGLLGPLGLPLLYCLKDRSRLILKKRQKESTKIF